MRECARGVCVIVCTAWVCVCVRVCAYVYCVCVFAYVYAVCVCELSVCYLEPLGLEISPVVEIYAALADSDSRFAHASASTLT